MQQSVICHNVANMYVDPDDHSECVHQLLCNEIVDEYEVASSFIRVNSTANYSGWIRLEHLGYAIEYWEPEFSLMISDLFVPVYEQQDTKSNILTHLTYSTILYSDAFSDGLMEKGLIEVDLPTKIEGEVIVGYIHEDSCVDCIQRFSNENASFQAKKMIGVPYLWGGSTPLGFDCSGLVYRIYDFLNVPLPRDAYQQYESPLGDKLSEGEPLQAGDLVFWVGERDPRNRGITHVGIMMDERQVIHAYSKMGVIVTPFAEMTSKLRYTYRGAWRYRNEESDD